MQALTWAITARARAQVAMGLCLMWGEGRANIMIAASIASRDLAVWRAMDFRRARVCRRDDGGVHFDWVSTEL